LPPNVSGRGTDISRLPACHMTQPAATLTETLLPVKTPKSPTGGKKHSDSVKTAVLDLWIKQITNFLKFFFIKLD
jgi:hypothetical protein